MSNIRQELLKKYDGIICGLENQITTCENEKRPLVNEYRLLTQILAYRSVEFTEEEKNVLENDLEAMKDLLDGLDVELHNLLVAKSSYLKTSNLIEKEESEFQLQAAK
ncbi:hypothetical protein LJC56_07075 [Christensenellaceae bacterium OttesenSCG-928-K19]|nr:hypothetical protein [Christensenellaceae bacterium OttesenSCG-928-K19]